MQRGDHKKPLKQELTRLVNDAAARGHLSDRWTFEVGQMVGRSCPSGQLR